MDKTPGKGQTYSNGNQMWHVPRLIELASALPVEEVPIHTFKVWDAYPWTPSTIISSDLGDFVHHMRRALDADLTKPIIVSAEGGIMDGCHRLAKAKLEGHKTILTVRFPVTPEPDIADIDAAAWAEMEAAEEAMGWK